MCVSVGYLARKSDLMCVSVGGYLVRKSDLMCVSVGGCLEKSGVMLCVCQVFGEEG